MRFAFTDEQLAFRDAVRELLVAECPPSLVRAAWEGGTGRAPALWHQLAQMGVVGLLAPESAGGLALRDVDLVLLLEESGYHALPDPIVETAAVAVPMLAEVGDTAWLPKLVDGSAVATVAGLGPGHLVTHPAADLVLAVGRGGAVRAAPGASFGAELLEVVDRARRVGRAREGVPPASTVVRGADVARAFDRAAVGAAAQLVGLAQRCLDLTVGYVKERHQFGVPIGSFQALKHQLATALMELEFARPAVYRAAYTASVGGAERARDASMAKAMASDAARVVARTALQCHGAIGYTVEYDLHLYFKRINALARQWGDAAWHRDRVAHALAL